MSGHVIITRAIHASTVLPAAITAHVRIVFCVYISIKTSKRGLLPCPRLPITTKFDDDAEAAYEWFRQRHTLTMTSFEDWSAGKARPRFTDWLKDLAEPTWSEAVAHKFTVELAAGALPDHVMRRYLVQDYSFLDCSSSWWVMP